MVEIKKAYHANVEYMVETFNSVLPGENYRRKKLTILFPDLKWFTFFSLKDLKWFSFPFLFRQNPVPKSFLNIDFTLEAC